MSVKLFLSKLSEAGVVATALASGMPTMGKRMRGSADRFGRSHRTRGQVRLSCQ
jgi:hypothetical protein